MKSTIWHKGLSFAVELQPDDSGDMPWERADGHGPVRHVRYYQRDLVQKAPGERILSCSNGGGTWLYDWAAAMKQAATEGWGVSLESRATLTKVLGREPTAGEVLADAVGQDFEFLRGFIAGNWSYIGVVVTLLDVDSEPTGETESLWGVESNSDAYIDETASELAGEIARRIGRKKYIESRVKVR
jgi:hypothetical protein